MSMTVSRETALPAAPALRATSLAWIAVAATFLAGFAALWLACRAKGFAYPAPMALGLSLVLAGFAEAALTGGALRALARLRRA